MRIVFFDLETGGFDHSRHPITQVAAIAVDADLNEIDSFEAKILFDASKADDQALTVGRYCPEIWAEEGVPASQVLSRLTGFLKRFADVRLVSQRTGSEYWVAQLAGYNAATFDGPFIQEFYRQRNVFMPASFNVLCVLQRVRWHFLERDTEQPENFKLATVCRHFGIDLDAHDALADCRATIALYRAILAAK